MQSYDCPNGSKTLTVVFNLQEMKEYENQAEVNKDQMGGCYAHIVLRKAFRKAIIEHDNGENDHDEHDGGVLRVAPYIPDDLFDEPLEWDDDEEEF